MGAVIKSSCLLGCSHIYVKALGWADEGKTGLLEVAPFQGFWGSKGWPEHCWVVKKCNGLEGFPAGFGAWGASVFCGFLGVGNQHVLGFRSLELGMYGAVVSMGAANER